MSNDSFSADAARLGDSSLSSGPVVKYKPVDPAGSHMLVSKIKPCMSQYKLLYGEPAYVRLSARATPEVGLHPSAG